MALLDELKTVSPAFATMSNQEIADYIHETYAPDWKKEDLYARVGYIPPTNPSSILKALPQGIESGFRQAQIGTNIALNALGLQGDESTANRVAELQRRQAEIAPTGATKEGLDAIRKAGESGNWGEALSTIASNPRAVGRLFLESAGSFIPDLALAAVTGGVAGIAAKALATRVGVAALAPEAIGLATKMAATAGTVGALSGKTEYGAEFLEALQDAGVDLTSSSSIRKAFQDEALMARAREEGLAKGIPVGLFDGLSMGLAGRFYGRLAGATLGSKLGAAGIEAGVQAGLGASGEALGQIAQKGAITNVADVLLEGILEVASAGPEAALNLRNNTKYQESLASLNKAADEASGAAQPHYYTPGGELSTPLADQLIQKELPNNPQLGEILSTDADPDTKRLDALKLIFNNDVEVAATPEQKAQIDQAKALTEPERASPPISSIAAAQQQQEFNDKTAMEDLAKFEATLNDLGPSMLETPLGGELRNLRSRVRDIEARRTTPQYEYGFPGQSDFPAVEPTSTQAAPPQLEPVQADPVTPTTQKSIERFINSIEQGNIINIGALQGAIKADLGVTPTLTEVKAALDSSPAVEKTRSGSYRRAPGTYQSMAAPVRTTPTTPTTRIPADRMAEDRLNFNPSPEPPGVSPINWYKANYFAQQTPAGKAVTPRMLRELGVPDKQIPPIMKAFQSANIVAKGAVPTRTVSEVRMPNTLSVERIAKLHKDELTGKSYGC